MTSTGIVLGVAAYLLGAIPTGWLVARARGVDIRAVGSGNIGATNVMRALGTGWGIVVLACDALKGFVPVFLFPRLAALNAGAGGSRLGMSLAYACLAVAGHVWPVFLRFRGGKGVATSAGAMVGLAPQAAGAALLAWLATFLAGRYVSLASIVGAVAAAGSAWYFYGGEGWLRPAILTLLAVITIWRHQANIGRLLRGAEHRVAFRGRTRP